MVNARLTLVNVFACSTSQRLSSVLPCLGPTTHDHVAPSSTVTAHFLTETSSAHVRICEIEENAGRSSIRTERMWEKERV